MATTEEGDDNNDEIMSGNKQRRQQQQQQQQDPAFAPESIADTGEWAGCTRQFQAPLRISVRGTDILTHPLFNKGTAFKSGERDRLRFRGLLPHRIMNIHLQKERFMIALRSEESNIRKNIMLEDLHDRNETLYHRVIVDHIEEIAPLIYTPTVGQACQEFATRYRRPRGMYFTEDDRGHMAAMVYNWPHKVRGVCEKRKERLPRNGSSSSSLLA